jgi:predicted DCC family thiol-disulfide oxidoreductase YuxK
MPGTSPGMTETAYDVVCNLCTRERNLSEIATEVIPE